MTDLAMFNTMLKDIRKLQSLVDKLKGELELDTAEDKKAA